MGAPQLSPVPKPIAIFPQFIAQQTETLALKEKVLSLTGDSFTIKLVNGQPLLRVEGKVMSISGRKSVYDMAGTHLFNIVKEHFHLHTTFAAQEPAGKKFLEVKSSFKLFGSKATATFTSPSTGNTESLAMRGNWLDSAAEIVDEATGSVVARIDRKLFRGRDIIFDQQSYAVSVAPGIDMALIAAMCICFDEKNNEN
ncbi:tubby C-terminal-like domain-containing protein [Aspergillus alliaceus]|uniref:Tubby C-terminal-like domain-containing protein n=1 Tax=Petromyces alliaceus TaxID=209559 RepID=A0A5N7CPY3_PETAA|nr:tubby C-terminal-like domain-containing protein [Aspergillus alliaceus]KAB8235717.1 tubby C-terminal-like domain-containing protein [Aspergillus alliaceus]KAE8395969.1 tubby C-terminal-like domain-containing protein [Aspergillus alliaceus]